MNNIFLLLLVLLLLFINFNEGFDNTHNHHNQKKKNTLHEACQDNLSDKQYLEHMIPHHQVAVDISEIMKKKSKNPTMQKIIRELIWTQNYEIQLMKLILNNEFNNISIIQRNNRPVNFPLHSLYPNVKGISSTYCDPLFFDPDKHLEEIKKMGDSLDDRMYVEHMIPHHQVAIDMSYKLLNNTKNDFMIELAYRIIRNQKSEIFILHYFLKSNYKYQSELLT